jgi:hypothetical protein
VACKCQGCGRLYKIDLLVSNEKWERIKPEGKAVGAGLLCGGCIILRLENQDGYGAYNAVGDDEKRTTEREGG